MFDDMHGPEPCTEEVMVRSWISLDLFESHVMTVPCVSV